MVRQGLFVVALTLTTCIIVANAADAPLKPIQVAAPAASATAVALPADGKTMSLAVKMPNGEVLNIKMMVTKEGYPMQPGPHTVIYREWSDLEG